jgi:hypothetical protein
MKCSFRHSLLALTALAFTLPGCGGCGGDRDVPDTNGTAGGLKAGPNGNEKTVVEKSSPEKRGLGFAYGDDDAGRLLAERLIPHRIAPPPPTGHATGPRPPVKNGGDGTVDLPIPGHTAEPPRAQGGAPSAPLRPKSAPADYPYSDDRADPDLPAKTVLPETGPQK